MTEKIDIEEKKTNEDTRFSSTNQPDSNGSPLMFEDVEVLQAKIDAYYKLCDERVVEVYDKQKQTVVNLKSQIPYTIEGLADELGCNRNSINNYSKKDRFYSTIAKARTKILRNKLERGLEGLNVAAIAKFDLTNNYDYKDKTEVDQTSDHVVNLIMPKPREEKP